MADDTERSSEPDEHVVEWQRYRLGYLKLCLIIQSKSADIHMNKAEEYAELALKYRDAAADLHSRCKLLAEEIAKLDN